MLALLIPISAYAQESQKQQKRRQAPRRPSARKAYVDHIRDTFRRTDERHGPVDHLNAGWGDTGRPHRDRRVAQDGRDEGVGRGTPTQTRINSKQAKIEGQYGIANIHCL